MKCYYHNMAEAVGTCKKCGKFLCKNCIDLNPGTGLCPDCVSLKIKTNKQKAEKAREDALVNTTSEFIKSVIIGAIIGIAVSFLMSVSGAWYGFPLSSKIIFFLVFFTVPYGWSLISHLQSKNSFSIFGTITFWYFWFVIKLVLSICIGIPAFIYQLVKFLQIRNSLKN